MEREKPELIYILCYVDIIGSGDLFSLVYYVDIVGSGEIFSLVFCVDIICNAFSLTL